LNPGSPAPQAGILDQARLRPLSAGSTPPYKEQRCSEGIINTLIRLKSLGKAEGTLKHVSFRLKYLARHTDLDDPEAVNRFIASLPRANSYKDTFVKSYAYYVKAHSLDWNKPKYKWERKIPKIPSTENINKVIARASRKYAVIFKMLMETGVMPYELSQVSIKDIDLEQGILSVRGFKGHATRTFKLKSDTLAMLKEYLRHYTGEKPFPSSVRIGKKWRKFRNILSDTLKDPALRTIRCYDLRHYFATMTYSRTRDPFYVKQQMGHKKLETILLYTQLINFGADEFTAVAAKNLQEACQLVEQGFEYVTDMDGVKIFRKRKYHGAG